MSIQRSARAGLFVLLVVSIVLVGTLFVIRTAAQAGIGNPIKKAKEKVSKTVTPDEKAPPEEPIVFDDVTLELTEARVSKITAAYAEAETFTAGRQPLVEKRTKAADERNKIDEKHGESIRDTQRKRGDVESCYHDGYNEAAQRKGEEYSRRALSDPALLQKYQKAAAENNAAAAAGDSAAIARLNAAMFEEISPTKEDSAAVRKKCGPLPPESAQEKRMNELDKEMASTDEKIRDMDDKAAKALSKKGGMTEEQWGTAMERIKAFLGATANEKASQSSGSKSEGGGSGDSGSGTVKPVRGFTDEESAALHKHLQELRKALGYN